MSDVKTSVVTEYKVEVHERGPTGSRWWGTMEFYGDGMPKGDVYFGGPHGASLHIDSECLELIAREFSRRRLLVGVGLCREHGYYKSSERPDEEFASTCPVCREKDVAAAEEMIK